VGDEPVGWWRTDTPGEPIPRNGIIGDSPFVAAHGGVGWSQEIKAPAGLSKGMVQSEYQLRKRGNMTDDIKIITNHRERNLLDWSELTEKEQKEFDYLDTDEKKMEASFVRYKGIAYDVGDFQYVQGGLPFAGWDGFVSDSFFSGVLLKWGSDGNFDTVIMGRYLA
jgi:hypothetical protein